MSKLTLNEIKLRHDNHTAGTQTEREFLLKHIEELREDLFQTTADLETAQAQLDAVHTECKIRLNPDTRYQDRESTAWENAKEDMAEDILAILEKES